MNEELKIIISAEISKFQQNVNKAKKSIKDFIKEGTSDFGAFNEEFQKVGSVAKKTLAVMGGAVAGAAAALLGLESKTKEYRNQQAMLNTAFQTAGASAETAKETYNGLFRVLGDSGQATEAAQHLASLTTEEKALSEWTNICQGVYATFGESLPIESLTEAVNHSANLGKVQGTLADALEWSGVNMDEFNEQLFWCNSESEREKLIRDTLNGVYSEAAANYETNNAAILEQNEAQAKLTDAMAALGEVMTPIKTMLMQLATEILAELTPHIKDFAEKYAPDIKEMLFKIGEAIGKVIGWIADHWELVSTLAVIIAGISAALTVFSTVMGIVNAVMLPVSGTVMLIVAAIAILVAGVILVIKYWDEIVAFTKKAWDAVKNAVKTAIDAIVGFFKNIIAWVKENWQGLLLLIANPFAGAFKLAYDNCEGFRKKVDTFLGKLKDAFKKGIDFIKKLFKFDFELPKIKVPKFSIKPDGWAIGDLLKGIKPTLGITWNARGGVFNRPTVFGYGDTLQGIGENGAEAVVPLENNTEWLDKIATRLASMLAGNNQPTILQVDGKTFAKLVETTVNARTRQTGRLGINIV